MNSDALTLLDVYDPVLLCVSRMRRAEKRNISLDFVYVRRELSKAFELAERRAHDAARSSEYQRFRPLVVHYVDYIIANSHWSSVPRWQAERGTFTPPAVSEPDALTLARQVLADPDPDGEVAELLGMLVSLGWHCGAPLLPSSPTGARPGAGVGDESLRIVPQAYSCTDRRDFVFPVVSSAGRWLIYSVLIIVLLVGLNMVIFQSVAGDLVTVVEDVQGKAVSNP